METKLNESELETDLRDVLDQVRGGARVVVERDGTAIAMIVPPPAEVPRGITGRELAARLGDLRMPGDGFADDIESARAALLPAAPPARPD
jgi:antitoxin (DNA-binding transcriptional repressor) of toxin-antitoxin stability system